MHDESLLEVEMGNITRVFFCRVLDHPPQEIEKESGKETDPPQEPIQEDVDDTDIEEEKYNKGDYLNQVEHIILTPLEPAEGNYLISTSPRIIVRALTSQAAIEFCCYFREKTRVDNMSVLELTFPKVARQVKGAREYRVKVPNDLNMEIVVTRQQGRLKFTTRPMDISMTGMSLYDPMGKESSLQTDDRISFRIVVNEKRLMRLNGVVCHVTRLRDSKGLQYVFGVQFDLATRALAADVEQLVATIQRARLRELSEIEDEYGVNLSNW